MKEIMGDNLIFFHSGDTILHNWQLVFIMLFFTKRTEG
jgi:hypothetical protein